MWNWGSVSTFLQLMATPPPLMGMGPCGCQPMEPLPDRADEPDDESTAPAPRAPAPEPPPEGR